MDRPKDVIDLARLATSRDARVEAMRGEIGGADAADEVHWSRRFAASGGKIPPTTPPTTPSGAPAVLWTERFAASGKPAPVPPTR